MFVARKTERNGAERWLINTLCQNSWKYLTGLDVTRKEYASMMVKPLLTTLLKDNLLFASAERGIYKFNGNGFD